MYTDIDIYFSSKLLRITKVLLILNHFYAVTSMKNNRFFPSYYWQILNVIHICKSYRKNEEVPSSAEPVEPAAEATAEKAEEAKPAEEPSETEGGSKPETGAETQKERKKWSQEAMMKLTRKFNLDLTPKVGFMYRLRNKKLSRVNRS